MNIFQNFTEQWNSFSALEWLGIIFILCLIGLAISATLSRKTRQIGNYECKPFPRMLYGDLGIGFLPVSKTIEELLPGECTETPSETLILYRTSVKRRHRNDNTWYFKEV